MVGGKEGWCESVARFGGLEYVHKSRSPDILTAWNLYSCRVYTYSLSGQVPDGSVVKTSILGTWNVLSMSWGFWDWTQVGSNLGCIVPLFKSNVNVNVDVYSLISPWVQQTLQFTPLILELSLMRSLISSGDNSAHFLQLMPIKIFPICVPPGRYPSLMGGQRQYGMRSLPHASTHDQHWESNPRPSNLASNALSTWPHAPIDVLEPNMKLKRLISLIVHRSLPRWWCLLHDFQYFINIQTIDAPAWFLSPQFATKVW